LINAFLQRRFWLWKNNFVSNIIIICLFPLFIFVFTNLAFRNIILKNLYSLQFDIWIFPGMVYIVAGLSIFPSIIRDIFDLRIHRKVLPYISLSPYSKRLTIFSFLIVSLVEAMIMGVFSLIIYSFIFPFSFSFFQLFVLIAYLPIYIFLIGNTLLTISIYTEKTTTFFISTLILAIYIILGSGMIIELSSFPSPINVILSYLPIGIITKAMHSLLYITFIDWGLTIISIFIIIIWTLANASLLRKKLRQ